MTKKVGIVALAAAALIAMAAIEADAHMTIVGGKPVYHSFACEATVKSLPNPATHLTRVECEATITSVDVLCRNNGGNIAPGHVPTNIVVGGGAPVTPGDITDKKKGIGFVEIPDVVPNCPANPPPDHECLLGVTNVDACPNENWELIDLIVRETTVVFRVKACSDEACNGFTLTSRANYSCVLDPAVDFSTVPPSDGIPYDCVQNGKIEHLQ